jgi:hypothetical protein
MDETTNDYPYPLMMSKTDFTVDPYTPEATEKYNTHVGITLAQYRFVAKNPAVNGPKVFHFIVVANGMKDSERESAFMDLLRAEQKRQDDEKTAAEKPAAQVSTLTPDGKPDDDPYSILRTTLAAMKTKKEVVEYVTKALDLKAVEGTKEAVIEGAIDALKARDAEVG